jgi:uncharacterized membrane protein YgcG
MTGPAKHRWWWIWLIAWGALMGTTTPAIRAEVIHDFSSQVQVHPDGHLIVTETIAVTALHFKIKRGIYRDFPTRYETLQGKTMRVSFKVLEVLRDGHPEPYHLRRIKDGRRLYIGQKNRLVKRGRHTYTITYSTDRQIGFFDDYDELYWNVTGNGWDFTIQSARIAISLPPDTQILSSEAYTGRLGAQGQDFWLEPAEFGQISLGTTRPLHPGEGFTIAISWPKGVVAPPDTRQRLVALASDNPGLVLALTGIILLIGYYLWAWSHVGRDPAKGTVIPRFEPPANLSPAGMRFLTRMKFDHTAFTAAILSLAVKGVLTIEEEKGLYILKKLDPIPYPPLSSGEKKILEELFGGYRTTLPLEKEQYLPIGSAMDALEQELKMEFEVFYFYRNRNYLIPGMIISIGILVALLGFSHDSVRNIALSIWGAGWLATAHTLGRRCLRSWRGVRRQRIQTFFSAMGRTLAFLAYAATGITSLILLTQSATWSGTLVVVTVTGVNLLFYWLLHAPTTEGRQLMDEIAGFKQFLSVAEKDRLEVLNPPQKTPELFERMLPFALALGVEHKWSAQFRSVLFDAAKKKTYQPVWYHGQSFTPQTFASFTAAVGSSLATAISASAMAPGSSSGTMGGGFSGGGGGGGGGGGW